MPSLAAQILLSPLWCALPLAGACGDAPPRGPEARLRARLEFPAGDARPTGLATIDLNGDGRDELIAVVRGPGAVQIWSGLSDRCVEPPRPRAFAIGDFALGPEPFGAPGATALFAVAPRAQPALLVVDALAIGKGSGDPVRLRLELEVRPRVLACGDLGQDGRPEIAVVNIEDELLLVRDGAIALRQELEDTQATCALFARDGGALYLGFQGSRRIVRLERGDGEALVEKAATTLPGLPRALLEVEGWEGLPGAQLLVAGGDDALWWLDAQLRTLRTDRAGTVPIDLALRGAARERDLLAVAMHGQRASLFRPAAAEPLEVYAGQHPVAGALGDFDGDGRRDVALANGDAKRISVLFGAEDGGLHTAQLARTGRAPHALAVGDLDGDARPDVVALCGLDSSVHVLRGGPDGLVAGVSQGSSEGADRPRIADIDGDGRRDLLFLQSKDNETRLDAWFGDGTGRLWARPDLAPARTGASPGDLLVADLDGDGALEAIATDPDASRVVLIPIERSGTAGARFGAARAIELPGRPVELALLAGGGRARVAVALSAAPPRAGFALLSAERGGDGVLALAEIAHAAIDQPARGIASGDFDADGVADVAVWCGSDAAGDVRVALSAADPARRWVGPLPAGLRPFALRAADLDGDGRSDLALSAQNSHHVEVWLARPGDPAAFLRLPDLGVGTGPLDVQLADLDGDGAPEIIVACGFSDEVATVRSQAPLRHSPR